MDLSFSPPEPKFTATSLIHSPALIHRNLQFSLILRIFINIVLLSTHTICS